MAYIVSSEFVAIPATCDGLTIMRDPTHMQCCDCTPSDLGDHCEAHFEDVRSGYPEMACGGYPIAEPWCKCDAHDPSDPFGWCGECAHRFGASCCCVNDIPNPPEPDDDCGAAARFEANLAKPPEPDLDAWLNEFPF